MNYCDNGLMKNEYICDHPGISMSTVRLLLEDMLKYVREAKSVCIFMENDSGKTFHKKSFPR